MAIGHTKKKFLALTHSYNHKMNKEQYDDNDISKIFLLERV